MYTNEASPPTLYSGMPSKVDFSEVALECPARPLSLTCTKTTFSGQFLVVGR